MSLRWNVSGSERYGGRVGFSRGREKFAEKYVCVPIEKNFFLLLSTNLVDCISNAREF